MSLSGKIALITGGTKGIGLATAKALRSLGATVVINYSSDATAADEAVNALGGPDHALAIKADVSKISDLQLLVDTVIKKYQKIDILINNAGIMIYENPSVITEEGFDKSFNINVKAPFFLTQIASSHIPEGGRIIFISTSLTGVSAITPNFSLYVATKGAVEQFARTAAKEFGAKGITVNTISPGPTDTDLFSNSSTEQATAIVKQITPAKRLGKPEEIANAIAFIASPQASWVNGQTIKVNGGFAV